MMWNVAQVWQRLDDVIMGGQSDSALAIAAEDSDASAVWRGELITEGGGFCGTRTSSQDWDLGSYDGIQLRVRGDGQTYKMNLKTVSTYACACKQDAFRLHLDPQGSLVHKIVTGSTARLAIYCNEFDHYEIQFPDPATQGGPRSLG